MEDPTRISAAGNVEVPAYLSLKAKGYTIDRHAKEDSETWFARKDGVELVAGGPIELLGLAGVYEMRGKDWMASDREIEVFVSQFC
jgi:hypothetical protein